MKNIINIIVKVAIVLFALSLFSEYINDITELDIFAKFNYDSPITKITFCIGYSFLAYYLLSNQVKRISINNIIVIGIIYSLYRFNVISHIEWNFVSLYQPVYYLDGIYPLLFLLYDYSKSKTNNESEKSNHNFIDPITKEKDDKFGFYKDAKQLVDLILTQRNFYQDTSMIIGLRGEWGEGKTSYLNMLELYAKECKNKEINIIRFNPWYSSSYEQMIKDLFAEFSKTLGYDITNKEFNNYAKALSDANIGIWSKIARFIHKSQDKTLSELHNRLNEVIKQHSKINIVLLDDLDRLNETEILNIFKLVRNNANFAKTIFIVSYDYEYIKNTLKNINDFDKYLEKIFPCPYILPECKKEDIERIKKSRMYDIIKIEERYQKSIDEFIDKLGTELSLRNAQRVALQITYNITNLKDEKSNLMVDLYDYLSLSYLSIIAPKVYKKIAQTNSIFSDTDLLVNYSGCLYLNFDRSQFSKYKEKEEEKYLSEKEYMMKLTNCGLTDSKAVNVYNILCSMFNKSNVNVNETNRKLFRLSRISNTRTFLMFFTRRADGKLLTKAEFDSKWDGDYAIFINSIELWATKNDQYSLAFQIANMQLTSKEDWIKAFDAMINIYPSSVFERFKIIEDPNILRYVTIPGEYTIGDLQRNSPVFIEYIQALFEYVQNIESDDVNKIRKKYVMLDTSFINNIIREIDYINLSIQNNSNGYNNWTRLPSFNIDEVREKNIDIRLSKIDSYDDFNSEYWYDCHNFELTDKLRIRDKFKTHIINHLDSFITNFSIDIIAKDMFISQLFYKYEVDEYQVAVNDKEWLPYFASFLENLSDKDDRIDTYLDGVKILMETHNK